LGFRVQGLGLRVEGLGFRVRRARFKGCRLLYEPRRYSLPGLQEYSGVGVGVWGLGFRVWDPGVALGLMVHGAQNKTIKRVE